MWAGRKISVGHVGFGVTQEKFSQLERLFCEVQILGSARRLRVGENLWESLGARTECEWSLLVP